MKTVADRHVCAVCHNKQ